MLVKQFNVVHMSCTHKCCILLNLFPVLNIERDKFLNKQYLHVDYRYAIWWCHSVVGGAHGIQTILIGKTFTWGATVGVRI